MPRRAWLFIGLVLAAGLLLAGRAFWSLHLPQEQVPTFLALLTLATLAQLFKVETPNHQLYHATPVFLFAALLLLHPALFTLIILVSFTAEWIKERWVSSRHLRHWYLQPFNMAMHVVSGICAHLLYLVVAPLAFSSSTVVAALLAVLCYVTVNHLLMGQALVLARGVTWRESEVLAPESLFTDTVQLSLGYVLALLVQLDPLLALPALLPLGLVYHSVKISQLKQEARTDAKTGLWNSRHFGELFTAELERASRSQRPVAVIMADLDLLRNINNTYGHLAGDAVLAGVGRIISQTTRDYDIAARFGGEEFIIALPETDAADALRVAERLRQAVEATGFQASTSDTLIRATLSLGVAVFPDHAATANALIHEADLAVYQAKLQGRNRAICAGGNILATPDEPMPIERRDTPFQAAFTGRPPSLTGLSLPEPMSDSLQCPAASPPAASPVEDTESQSEQMETGGGAAPAPRRTWNALNLYVLNVILVALLVTAIAWLQGPPIVWTTVLALVGLALVAELLQVDLYRDGTVSISVSLTVAAALLVGLPGVAAVSAAIAGLHYVRRRPALYKTAFNWATHLLSGSVPFMIFEIVGLPLTLGNLPRLAVPAVIAAGLLYLAETGLVAGAIALQEGASPYQVWQKHFRWLAQHYIVLGLLGFFVSLSYLSQGVLGAVLFAVPVLMMHFAQHQYADRTKESISALEGMNQALSEANQAVREINNDLFLTVARLLDARDPFVSSHTSKVADYAVAIAREMGIEGDDLEIVRQSGLLHDIGKIGIQETVLYKPAKLTDEEYEYMKQHATIGAELLMASKGLRHLVPFVRHHHERWDGRGYPDSLAGEASPRIARILALADAVEAMASDRPYHRGMPIQKILEEVQRCAGSHFDPEVAEAFIRVMEREGAEMVVNSAREVLARKGAEARIGFELHDAAWVTTLRQSATS